MKTALILTTVAMFASAYAQANDMTGDALKGRELAQRECSQCHRVGRAALPLKALHAAPAFGDIAKSASITPTSLFVFLHSSHPPMPNIILSQQESADVIAYIMSLRPARL